MRTTRVAVATRVACGLTLTLALVLLNGVAPLGQQAQRGSSSQKIDRALDALLANGPGPEAVRLIIRTRDPGARESLKSRLHAHGDQIQADHASIDAFTATVHLADLRALADDPATSGISIDAVVTAHQTSTNSLLGTLLLPDSHAKGSGVRVAVIDSGLRLTNDLASNRVLGFYDFTRNDRVVAVSPYDDYGHGTHVAGLIAGNGANSQGFYTGIAPAASVLALKVLDKNGSGYTSDVIQAIEFIIANQKSFRIDVINLSLGHPIFESATTDPLVLAIQQATEAGIVVVVAAGNSGQDPTRGLPAHGGITSPGNAPSAITVGALNTQDTIGLGDDTIPVYSSRGPTWYDAYAKPDLVAPGHRLVSVAALRSTLYRDYPHLRVVGTTGDIAHYFRLSGTSMATAVASGAVALMLAAPSSTLTESPDPALLTALYDLGAEIVAAPDVSCVADQVDRMLNRLMPAACTAVFSYSSAGDSLVAHWVAGQHRAAIQGLTIPVGRRLTGWVAANHSTIVNSDAALDLGNLTMQLTPAPHWCLSTSIYADAELVGVLTIYSTSSDPFSEAHATIVEAVASRLSRRLQRARGAAAIETSGLHRPFQEGAPCR